MEKNKKMQTNEGAESKQSEGVTRWEEEELIPVLNAFRDLPRRQGRQGREGDRHTPSLPAGSRAGPCWHICSGRRCPVTLTFKALCEHRGQRLEAWTAEDTNICFVR